MPWRDDPDKQAEAVRRWRAAHPGYWRRYARGPRAYQTTISRYRALEEDVLQQAALHRLSRRQEDSPEAFRLRERRWIQATDFWSADGTRRDDGSDDG